MVEHIVELVEAKAAQLQAERAATDAATVVLPIQGAMAAA
jgi:hypothetical protein